MAFTTHTVTGDIASIVDAPFDTVTAYLEPSLRGEFVHDPGSGSVLPSRVPVSVEADGTFSTSVIDSSESGLSYRLVAEPRLDGRRLPGVRSGAFTVNAAGRFDEMPFVPPDISEAQRLAALTDAQVAALVADGDSLTQASLTALPGLVNAKTIPGVDATGATDSTTALNGWLADPPAGAQGIWFPAGTYVASLKVTTPGLTLTSGGGAAIKVPDDATQHVTDAGIRVLADDVTIKDLTIDGNATGNPHITGLEATENSDGIGIYADNCTVESCTIVDPIGHGVIVWGLAYPNGGTPEKAAGARRGSIIRGNRITGNLNRAALDMAFNQGSAGDTVSVVSGNTVDGNSFVLHSTDDVSVTGNTFAGGVTIHTESTRVAFAGNVVPGAPLNIQSGHDITVTGNVCNSLVVTTGASTSVRGTNITVANNRAATVITVEKVDGVTVQGNTCAGQLTVSDVTKALVSGNRCDNYLTTTATRLDIIGNQMTRIAADAVTGARIANNDVAGSSVNGIKVTGSDIQVINNRIATSTTDGINIGDGVSASNVYVADNVVTGSGRYGVFVGASAATVRIQDNMISGSTTADILSHGSATGVTQVNNGKAYGRVITPAASTLTHATAAAWVGANYAVFSRFSLDSITVLRYLRFFVGVSSGNVQVGVVKFSSATAYTRVMNSGIVTCPASGIATVDLGAYTAGPGDYGLFLWADNTTFSTLHTTSDVAKTARLCSVLVNSASGVPASGSIYEDWNKALLGASLETDA